MLNILKQGDLKFSQCWRCSCWYSGFICHIILVVVTTILEESIASSGQKMEAEVSLKHRLIPPISPVM